MSLPQLFPRVKAYLGTVNSPLHGRQLALAQGENGFILLEADSNRLTGKFTIVKTELLTHVLEELKGAKQLSHDDEVLSQKARAWDTALAGLTSEELTTLLYSALLVLSQQRKVRIQEKDRRIQFRRLNQAASVEVDGVANVFDSGGLTLARLPVASFEKLVSVALDRGFVSSELVREVLPMESQRRKEFAFSMAKWLQVYLELEIRG